MLGISNEIKRRIILESYYLKLELKIKIITYYWEQCGREKGENFTFMFCTCFVLISIDDIEYIGIDFSFWDDERTEGINILEWCSKEVFWYKLYRIQQRDCTGKENSKFTSFASRKATEMNLVSSRLDDKNTLFVYTLRFYLYVQRNYVLFIFLWNNESQIKLIFLWIGD